MNTLMKRSFYGGVGMLAMAYETLVGYAFDPDRNSAASKLEGNKAKDMVVVVENIVSFVVGLLYLIAIIFVLYGGFQILTAGGDEDKVKKGKDTIVRGAIGLAVIFLASTLVSWIISLFQDSGKATT